MCGDWSCQEQLFLILNGLKLRATKTPFFNRVIFKPLKEKLDLQLLIEINPSVILIIL